MAASFEISKQSQREFAAALRLYKQATDKDASDVLNRATKNVIYRCVQFSPKANKGKVRTDSNPYRSWKNKKRNRLWAQAAKDGFRRGEGIGKEVDKRYNRRLSSIGYIAAGFLSSVTAFGGRPSRGKLRPIPGGDAARGRGKKARATKLVATFENFATDADKVAGRVVEQAMRFVSADMLDHAQKRMQKTANKYAAR